eukprot:comp63179_c0_seq1/m.47941 comp63179_c0_seq1/g.47941  ORF comp63179_c0_seq1/g.47941 comp63179_c0_seq1/m.47941 type:complete len:209 (-) comp63179_c0_seq1:105-731(-)
MSGDSDEEVEMASPPEAFAIVEPGVYRSNIPYPVHFPFLKQLGLNTVVVLSPERPVRTVTDFFEESKINMIHLGQKTWSVAGWRPVSEELIKEGLELVLDVTKHPIMIMCTFGIHQSGVLVGCLRKLQRWNLNSILYEYNMYAREKSRYMNVQFIEIFDLDLVTLPSSLPQWYLDQQKMLEDEKNGLLAMYSYRQADPGTGDEDGDDD